MSTARTIAVRKYPEAARVRLVALAFALGLASGLAPAQQPAGAQAVAKPASAPPDMDPAVDTSAQPRPGPAAAAGGAPPPAGSRATTPRQDPPRASAPPRGGRALDRLELESTQITGNRELPKVLYIVPWKRPELGDLLGRPVNSLLDEVLAPVDREVFQRETHYYETLAEGSRPDATKEGGAGAPEGRAAAGARESAAPGRPATSPGSTAGEQIEK